MTGDTDPEQGPDRDGVGHTTDPAPPAASSPPAAENESAGDPPPLEPASSAPEMPVWARIVHRIPIRFVEPVLRGFDGLYIAFQGALKVYGLVPDHSSAEEIRSEEEGRQVVLSAREGRWPELRLPLPPTASHWFSVASVYRRGHVWRVAEPVEEIAAFYRRALRDVRGEVTEEAVAGRAEFTVSGDDLDVLVKISRLPQAGVPQSPDTRIA